MACDCIKNLEEKVVQDPAITYKDRKITRARVRSVFAIEGKNMVRRPVVEMIIYVEGMKRQQQMEVAHGYCPFCGKIYEEKEVAND